MAGLCAEEVCSDCFQYSENLKHRLLQELRKQSIQIEHLISVFIIGSTLWGTRNEHSDYDMYVIHNSDAKHVKGNKVAVSSGEFDLQLCHIDEFKIRLNNHEISSILLKYHPIDFTLFNDKVDNIATILQSHKLLIEELFEQHQISPTRLLDSVCKETNKDWQRVNKLFSNNEFTHGLKVAMHVFRSFMLAVQLIEHDEVIDWKCGNELQLLDLSCDSLEDCLISHLQPLFNTLKFKLINIAKPQKERSMSVRLQVLQLNSN